MRPLSKEEEASVSGGRTYKTPAGNTVKFNASLSDAQAATLGQIVDYGKAHNMLAPEIRMAVNQAFYESSLGSMTSNPTNSNVQGLYQYDANTWDYLGHGALDRSSTNDQIAAMYDDIRNFESRWAAGRQAGTIPTTLLIDDYVEIKHHLGPNSTQWSSPVVSDYNGKVTVLGFTSVSTGTTAPPDGSTGGAGSGGHSGGGGGGSSGGTGGTVIVGPPQRQP
ncbi:MAG: Uncharacterized protein K0R79_700 [Stenotrophomonas indicatrix]|jgi:uncharacterized membrane protein YgcG|uniref:Transglycosylase SLT domain-containing protein n=1 Tax=Stenotrophomonas indicatrix TaxID=2045451 RepID=A0A1W1GWM7_9GAMM|nr:hypothetical protein [Stenotrophomonas indicatrix]MDF2480343.1 Uncharacterized protein [Stenotrophomonas indicatrix]MDN8643666.1 hypothetical protein [Stenotrophomonas indicatrix]MDN8648322.1 hypothetical protein [Stenotrophomonas indicatrix]MDN8654883.1 hypothetical protein [Stenotrophomonas indicatrix]QXQ04226.1 hypothetical protein KX724_09115 [Stenotrophomonas indicatrix]